jgi:hypothetical protein
VGGWDMLQEGAQQHIQSLLWTVETIDVFDNVLQLLERTWQDVGTLLGSALLYVTDELVHKQLQPIRT